MAKELFEELKDWYPAATDEQIEQYIEWISNHDADRLPPTPEMQEYEIITRQIKDLESKQDKLKAKIIEQKERTGHNFLSINISQIKKRNFHDDEFYNWCESHLSRNLLKEVTIKTIDQSKFLKLTALGKINYEDLPDSCYTESKYWKINLPRKKKGNKDLLGDEEDS